MKLLGKNFAEMSMALESRDSMELNPFSSNESSHEISNNADIIYISRRHLKGNLSIGEDQPNIQIDQQSAECAKTVQRTHTTFDEVDNEIPTFSSVDSARDMKNTKQPLLIQSQVFSNDTLKFAETLQGKGLNKYLKIQNGNREKIRAKNDT